MKCLGRKPPKYKYTPDLSVIARSRNFSDTLAVATHYRQSLLEAADELEMLIPRVKGIVSNPNHIRLFILAKELRISAGVK